MKKKIVIFGAGGHAHVIKDIIIAEGNDVIAMLDDDKNNKDAAGPISSYGLYSDCFFVIGVGDFVLRTKLSKIKVNWHTAIHPSSIISPSVKIGDGTVVMPNAVINSGSKIGKHCIINSGSIIEHDNHIGENTHISVGAKTGGNVTIGSNVFVGLGSNIINNISICQNAIIGAGSLVLKSINDGGTYVGVPVKKIK